MISRGAWTNHAVALLDRLRCFFAAHYLEAVDARLKGSPHRQLAAMVHGADAHILGVLSATGFLGRIVAAGCPHAQVSALGLSPGMSAQGRVRARGIPNIEFVNG